MQPGVTGIEVFFTARLCRRQYRRVCDSNTSQNRTIVGMNISNPTSNASPIAYTSNRVPIKVVPHVLACYTGNSFGSLGCIFTALVFLTTVIAPPPINRLHSRSLARLLGHPCTALAAFPTTVA